MVHGRDDQEVGMAHEVKSTENQPHMTMGQHWLGKTKPKQAFRLLSKSCNRIFLKIYLITNWYLQTSVTQKQLRLLTVWRCLRGAFWHTTVRPTHSSGTYQWVLLCVPFILLTMNSVNSVVAHDGFLCITEIVPSKSSVFFIDYKVAFQTVINSIAV